MQPLAWIIVVIIIAVAFEFLNGFNDSANIAATIISSRSMSAQAALRLAAIAGFAGPFIFGVAVAKTIGHSVVITSFMTPAVLVAALTSASVWCLITWAYGIPSSSSHALVGGLIGAVIISGGIKGLLIKGLAKIFISLLFSPVAGLLFGWLAIKITLRLLKHATPKANRLFKLGQIPTAIALAAANGANDAQKTMGIITIALITTGYQDKFFIPLWVMVTCAGAKSLGSFIGGWRIIRTIGAGFYKIKPVHSFTSQLASSAVIIMASIFGGPVSTTQVVSMAVVGAGAGERVSQVRWLALKDISLSWLFTIPLTVIIAMPVYLLIKLIFI